MADLFVRDVDDRLIQALIERAAKNRRSVQAEHRAILEQALRDAPRKTLAEVLASMPAVGRDADFERTDDTWQADPSG